MKLLKFVLPLMLVTGAHAKDNFYEGVTFTPVEKIKTRYETVNLTRSLSLDGFEVAFFKEHFVADPDYTKLEIALPTYSYWSLSPNPKGKDILGSAEDTRCESYSKRCALTYKTEITLPYKKGLREVVLYSYEKEDSKWVMLGKYTLQINPSLLENIIATFEKERALEAERREKALNDLQKERFLEGMVKFAESIAALFVMVVTVFVVAAIIKKRGKKIKGLGFSAKQFVSGAVDGVKRFKEESVAANEVIRHKTRTELDKNEIQVALIAAIERSDFEEAKRLTALMKGK
uniref:Uncharacterized protein n=1 Tax=Aliivibrio fischeri TaxID=668 RepID=H2ERS4_ALIFS|nr:hypothetical protein [Aliivibrio fischeri]AEY78091.1 hypothetical protein [Aliivibrio fischeri]